MERAVGFLIGAHFGIGRYLRIGFGYDIAHIQKGLRRIDTLLAALNATGRASVTN